MQSTGVIPMKRAACGRPDADAACAPSHDDAPFVSPL
jgi:hypothetical protein